MSTNRSLHVFPLLSLTALVLIAPACDTEVDVDSEFERAVPVDMGGGGCDYDDGCDGDDGSEPPRPATPRPKKPNPGKPPEKTPSAADVDELMRPID